MSTPFPFHPAASSTVGVGVPAPAADPAGPAASSALPARPEPPAGTTLLELSPSQAPNDEQWAMVVRRPGGAPTRQQFENRAKAMTAAREMAYAERPAMVLILRRDGALEERFDFDRVPAPPG